MSETLEEGGSIDVARNLELQRVLLSICEGFSDYFVNMAQSIWGQHPKSLTFNEVSVSRKIGVTGIQLVSVSFSTEFGSAHASLAVKIYKDENEVIDSSNKINLLAGRIRGHKAYGITTPRILFQRGPILVMEGIQGFSFNRSNVPNTEKYRLAGRALAALHSSKKNIVDWTKNEKMIPMIVENLPSTPQVKEKLLSELSTAYDSVKKISNRAGAVAFGDFHQGNLMFEVDLQKRPVSAVNLIDPEFLEMNPTTDRLEDIANFFSHKAISEWETRGKFFQLLRDIEAFIAGYNGILAYDNIDIFAFYDSLPPMNFHLALRVLFSILNLSSLTNDANYLNQQVDMRVQLALNLLKMEPVLTKTPVF